MISEFRPVVLNLFDQMQIFEYTSKCFPIWADMNFCCNKNKIYD